MKEFEKKLIKDKKLFGLLEKEFNSISKMKNDKIDLFLKNYKDELDEISKDRNWKLWFKMLKKNFKKENDKLKEIKEKSNKTENKKKIKDDQKDLNLDLPSVNSQEETYDDDPTYNPGSPKKVSEQKYDNIVENYHIPSLLQEFLIKLEKEIIKKLKIKEWCYSDDLEQKINIYREKYRGIDKEGLNKINKGDKSIIDLYIYLWQVTLKDLFSDDYSRDDNFKEIHYKIIADIRLKYFNKEEINPAKWIKYNHNTVKELINNYGFYAKKAIIEMIDIEIDRGLYKDKSELPEFQLPDEDIPLDLEGAYIERPEEEEFGTQTPKEKPPFWEGDDPRDSNEESTDDEIEIVSTDMKTVSQHRKAFVKWVNEELYKKIDKLKKDSPLQIYQLLIREYLSLDMPYRGVLVYHGLGTGKTASAVSLAEGLSSELKINTLLPASLENEFIKEIQIWGNENINKTSLWKFYSMEQINKDLMMNEIEVKYNLTDKALVKIIKNTQKKIKKQLLIDDPTITKLAIKKMEKQISSMKGVYLPDKEGKHMNEYDDYSKIHIEEQINYLIRKKYNFIHYNPFPRVSNSSINEFIEEDEEEDDYDLLLDNDEQKKLNTENKRIVDSLEKKLKNNVRKNYVNSPFYKEVLIIDEVHNFVRQILNSESSDINLKREGKRARIFYDWIVNSEDVKLIFLSGTPVINKPSEIAILYNMLKGLIKIYSFSIKTDVTLEEANKKLNDFYYKKESSIELFHITQNEGKLVISFIKEKSSFQSLRDPDNNIIYTVKSNDTSFKDFIDFIYEGLHKIFDKNDILPKKTTVQGLSKHELGKIQLGEPVIYDNELELVFNKQQKLFDIYDEDNSKIDTTNNENFIRYFFEGGVIIPEKKRILLKRMLMGLTSYYPIDRSSIVYMPQVVDPEIIDQKFTPEQYEITKSMNIVRCKMSQIQFENYYKGKEWQRRIEDIQMRRNIWEDEINHYSIRTRQACNVVFNDEEDFRMMKKNFKDKKQNELAKKEIERIKQSVYSKIRDNKIFKYDKDLKEYSPKFYEILKNIQKFTPDKKPKGKILFYSDFRSDAGSEAFELMLQCNGYSKLDTDKLPDTKALRYTFITGSESAEERRISKTFYNDENNEEKINKYGEYCQIMIISSAGAEGISLTCVRQVHVLEPYWNFVRIDQVLGRAIRMRSHTGKDLKKPWLPKDQQNVEQYLYITELPNGISANEVYEYIKECDNWEIPKDWKIENVKTELSKEANIRYRELIDNIIDINVDDGSSSDEYLFDIMNQKYKFSLEINNVIKESSLDCIKHTLDSPELNDKCIRFSDKLLNEIAYFPGIGSKIIDQLDNIQLKSTYIYRVEPNIFVIAAVEENDGEDLYIYYNYQTKEKDVEKIDIRYVRDNGDKLCDYYPNQRKFFNYVKSSHPYNNRLGKEFSVYQEIYPSNDKFGDMIRNKNKFPSLDEITDDKNLIGYKLKYNIDDSFFFMGLDSIKEKKCIQKIYPYEIYEIEDIFFTKPIIILNEKLYIKN